MGIMRNRNIIASAVAGVVAVAAVAGGFAYVHHRKEARLDQAARASAERFAGAWSRRDVHGLTYAGLPATQVAASFTSATSGLGTASAKVAVTSLNRDGDKADGKLSVAWTVAKGTTWTYAMPIQLKLNDNRAWAVVAKGGASMWAPGLSANATLVATRTSGKRGDILDRHGVPIMSIGRDITIDPARAWLSGLQGQYNKVLSGTSGVKVTSSDKPGTPLLEKPAVNGKPMTLTMDTKTQKAAEAALGGSGKPSALVAVDVATGDLLAVANSPAGGMNRALLNRYAPGSTLKVATTYSLLTKGLTPSTPVPCPPAVVIEGSTMRNYDHETLGTVPFSVDFAKSCNTAFVGLSTSMGNSDVSTAAAALGVGAGWGKHLGVNGAFDGSVPVATSKTERATTAFGQAKTEASPASLAVMAASVARGRYIEPALISSPAVTGANRTPKPLNAKAASDLRSLMRLVVTKGTATAAIAGTPGGPIYGKTGTAEYGTSNPPATHAWFVGWQGNVAFAVLVEDGKSGATVAAPVAKAFLTNLQH